MLLLTSILILPLVQGLTFRLSPLMSATPSFVTEFQSNFQAFFQQNEKSSVPRADDVIRSLFSGQSVDPSRIAQACSLEAVWVDLGLEEPIKGPDAITEYLRQKFPPGSYLAIERVADGAQTSGFTWHREADTVEGQGLRGTTFVSLDSEGQIDFITEGYEPIFKPGELTAKLLQAISKNFEVEEIEPSYTSQTPRTAQAHVKYLWEEAYPKGAKPEEAIRQFAEGIVYEDFNYEEPFVGIPAVTDFLAEFDFPGIEFFPELISEGDEGCCFTWRVKINGEDGPKGISFYGVDKPTGKISYIRDIPAPSIRPPPLGSLAARLQPALRVFEPRK